MLLTVLYNSLLLIILIGFPLWLPIVLLFEKRRKTLSHRLLFTRPQEGNRHSGNRPPRHKSIWVHALSVGETLSAAPLLSGLKERFPGHRLVLTVSTQTGYELAQQQLSGLATETRYAPLDLPVTIGKAVRRLNPAIVFIVETDIWPNFVGLLKHHRIPVFLVNARLSERSYRGYRRLAFFFRPLFSLFTAICAQSEQDARRYRDLGVAPEKIHLSGNLKFDQLLTSNTIERPWCLRKKWGIRPDQPLIVAGSTHEGEEAILLQGIRRLRIEWPTLVLILSPRNPNRAPSICRMALDLHLNAHRVTTVQQSPPEAPLSVLVVDVMGILREIYALADIAFVGGSLVHAGGHNPLEPAAAGKPILFGPDMSDFESISRALETAGGAERVHDESSFCRTAHRLLSDPEATRTMGERARGVFKANGGAVNRILAMAETHIEPLREH